MVEKPFEITWREGDDLELATADTPGEARAVLAKIGARYRSAQVNGMAVDRWHELGCPQLDHLSAPTVVSRRKEQLRGVYTNPNTLQLKGFL